MLARYDEENGFSGLLASIQKLKELPSVTKEVTDGFDNLLKKIGTTENLNGWVGSFDELAKSCGVTDKSFTDFLETTQKSNIVYKTSEDAIAGYQSYLKSTSRDLTLADLRTKALSASMKVLSSIGWMALITAATWVIGKAVKGIGNYVKRVEEARNANEKFANQFNELNSSLKQDKETIESVVPRYNELSKYVNNLGTNIGLTKEEFEEYHDITQQIAEMYPSLVTGYDAQGYAIVNLKDTLAELNAEFERDKENAYWELIGKAPEVLKNFDTMMNASSEKSFSNQLKRYEKLLELFTGDYEEARSFLFNGVGDYYSVGLTDLGIGLDFEEKDMDRILGQIRNKIQSLNIEIEAETRKVTPLLEAYLNTNDDYKNFDIELKTALSTVIQNLSPELIGQFNDGLDISGWVNELVEKIKNNPDITNALVGLFNVDTSELSFEETQKVINSYINYIAELVGESPVELKIKLGFEDVDTAVQRQQEVTKRFAESFSKESALSSVKGGGKKYLSSYEDLNNFVLENSINTNEEWNRWEQILETVDKFPDSFDKAAEAKRMYLEADTSDETPILSVSDTINLLDTKLKPAFDSLQSAYQKIFTIEDGKEIFTLENVDLSMLKDVQSSIEELNKTGFNIDLSSYDEFAQTLSDSSSTADEVREVINNLATSVLDGTNAIDGMDESTAQLVATMLESLGVANAEEIVTHELAASKEEARLATLDLANASVDSMKGLLNEAGAAGLTRGEIYKLAAAEIAFGDNDLNFSGKIAKLQELAGAYGDTATQAMLAAAADRVAAGHGTYESVMEDMMAQFNKAAGSVEIDFSNVGGGSKAAGKSHADAYIEAFEKELSKLDDLKNRGKITEKQYLDSLRRLYQKYFAQKEKYLDQFERYENQYLSGMKSLYESAFSYITKQIDKRIDAIQKERDAQVESLEAQKKASEEFYQSQIDEIDDQIDAIDKEIKAKQELIDTINDAADARQREIDLQKAQYDLERMQNQNTQLVYKDGQMIYEADTSGIRDAREEVEDKKRDIEIATIEKVIDGLEKQKDLLEERREALEKALDASNAYWDAQIEQTEKHFDSLISNLEETKSKFEELGEVFENAKLEATLQELGINMEALLSGSTEEFDKLKNSYIGILADMGRGNDEIIGQLSKLAGVNAESVSYLESTKGAFENLGAATLDPLSSSVEETATATEGLSTSASEASTAVSDIGTNASNTTASIAPLNDELQKLKDLISELTTLFNSLEFPTPGDDGYAQKLEAIATAFGNIATKCKEFEQIDFSSIIGTGGESEGLASNAEGSTGSGFTGLATAISDAVITIDEQMNNLTTALQIGNEAFAEQIGFITDEYIPAWEELQTRLAEIIGVGGGGDNKNPKDKKGGSSKKSGNSDGESSGGDNIIGIMQTGGEEVSAKLQDPWLTSFNDFATGENSIQSIAELIKEIVTEMATSIQSQCESAAKAIKDLADTALNSSISVGGSGYSGKAYAKGYGGLPRDEKNALVGEVAPELVVDPESGQYSIFTTPTITDLNKGSIIYNGDDTKKILSGNGDVSGNAYAEGTKSYPPNIVPVNWSDPKNENLRKFNEYLERNANVLDTVATMKNPLNDIADSVSSINRVVTNNVNSMRNIEINIGDIQLQGVQNANGLADAIITRLPNMVAQELHRRY